MKYKFRAVDLSGNYITDIGSIEFFVDGQIIVNGEIPVRHLLQYTGVKDKNGVEVYQGDIVKQPIEEYNGRFTEVVGYGIYEIKFKDDIYMNVGEGEGEWLCLEEFRGCEVIGSIYTNPELLNAK